MEMSIKLHNRKSIDHVIYTKDANATHFKHHNTKKHFGKLSPFTSIAICRKWTDQNACILNAAWQQTNQALSRTTRHYGEAISSVVNQGRQPVWILNYMPFD